MRVHLEYLIVLSFFIGMLLAYINLPYLEIFTLIVDYFIYFFVELAPLIVFIIILSSASNILAKGGRIYRLGGWIIILIIVFSYISTTMGLATYVIISRSYLRGSNFLGGVYLYEIGKIYSGILFRPIIIAILLSFTIPYVIRGQLIKHRRYVEGFYKSVLNGFKSITKIMPLISLGLGISLYKSLEISSLQLVIEALTLIFIVGLALMTILTVISSILTNRYLTEIMRYTLKIFFSALPLGGSYLALPLNLRIFDEAFQGYSGESDLALTIGASLNRCGSVAGAIIAVYLSSLYTGISLSLPEALIMALIVPIVSLGAPGMYGGTLLVAMPVINHVLSVESSSMFSTTALALFVGVMTFVQASVNTTTNGYIALLTNRRKADLV